MNEGKLICTVEPSAEEVDAGAEFNVAVRVVSDGDEPANAVVAVLDSQGSEQARARLFPTENATFETGDISLRAPPTAGEHAYRAVVLGAHGKRKGQEIASVAFQMKVKPHTTQAQVWDLSSAISVGARTTFRIGIACSCGCNLAGQRLQILDHDGRAIATAALGPAPWSGTDALYFAEAEIEAPAAVGRAELRIVAAEWTAALPHAECSVGLTLNVVPAPDCTVTIEALDRESRAPIAGATVVLHPYRARTGADGVARVEVRKGQYDVLVSGPRRVPFTTTIEVVGDIDIVAELDADESWKSEDEQFG